MTKGPTESQWRLEIEKAMGRSSDDGATARELSKSMGMSLKSLMWKLTSLDEAGLLGVGWRSIVNKAGIPGRVPVYWIRKEKKK